MWSDARQQPQPDTHEDPGEIDMRAYIGNVNVMTGQPGRVSKESGRTGARKTRSALMASRPASWKKMAKSLFSDLVSLSAVPNTPPPRPAGL